ncbi:PAS domain S-box protein [Oceanicella sp. SM1341]|uniref:PAS domain S-box protein n=1 Tax=Oceanicella sp. SM1341 TaxID=1548889 RepID=UPI000E4FF24F|nr:PAS domain S-box protein [Oceanicella sp. SM1341]
MNSQERLKEHLAAIVEDSNDAIVTKDLNSVIQTWNRGAERLFGFTAAEAIGRPITMIIPPDRLHEEDDIIAKLRRGERIQHFETMRQRKDGSLVPISLTISPVRDASGEVIGASKIARDISLQKEAAERQRMLLAEMRHRVGNCFAVAASLIAVTARQVETASELATLMQSRLLALSSAHKLAVTDPTAEASDSAALRDLVSAVVIPFSDGKIQQLDIEDVRISPDAITPLALVFHELCTNAIKYGALGQSDGFLSITAGRKGDRFVIDWQEFCRIDLSSTKGDGFGTSLCHDVVKHSLGGTISRHFEVTGMRARIDLDVSVLDA